MALAAPVPAEAQLDPLLFLKTQRPNVLLVIDTANRMQHDADGVYYDPAPYAVTGASFELTLGVTALTATSQYYRKYVDLVHRNPSTAGGDRFAASRIESVGDRQNGFATFYERTRLALARRALARAVQDNTRAVRFGLIKTRQASPTLPGAGNEAPVSVSDPAQQNPTDHSVGKWKITRTTVSQSNSTVTTSGLLVAPDTSNANSSIVTILNRNLGTAGALLPAGTDSSTAVDAPVSLMLDDARAEAARLIANDPACANTVVVLVVGGGEGTINPQDLAAKASTFLNVSGRRVPIYVVAVAPAAADVDALRAVATTSGGQFYEITRAMIEAVPPGSPVPEMVRAVNEAVQHTFASSTDFNTAPTEALPIGPQTEYQATSPIVGTVNLIGARDINGNALPYTAITTPGPEHAPVPQRANVMVTSGFAMPGFEGRLRAYRVYRPVPDTTRPVGYRFDADGTPLWVARAPAAGSRNIYTVLPDGGELAFTAANAALLAQYLRVDEGDAAALIDYVRGLPLGAVVGSTPAIMDPPSLDPPPDQDYIQFALDNKNRRSLVFVGGNHGLLHAIDGRLGVEVWAYVPFNLLPKLRALREGQPVDAFRYFVDSSPKVADVKVNGRWRTFLFIGQGPGGTFYHTLDVTLDGMESSVSPVDDSAATVLNYFATPGRIAFKWSFPRLTSFDHTLAPYGDVAAAAPAVEKTVGQTWSDPAVGQVAGPAGPYAIYVGSGFLPRSTELLAHRGGVAAGTTFYVLDVATGTLLASRDVGNDGVAETVDDCRAINDCRRVKNALQMDPVATGPFESRYVTYVYVGDLDGRVWRFDLGLNTTNDPVINGLTRLYTDADSQPMFSSMAILELSGTRRLVLGTGSDLLPANGVTARYKLLVLLDNGSSASKSAEIPLTNSGGVIEMVSAFPAVAGEIVFFTTTSYNTAASAACSPFTANLYAVTYTGGPAYDTNDDGRLTTSSSSGGGGGGGKGKSGGGGGGSTSADSQLVFSQAGARATAPFIADQHLVFAAGGRVELFGDPRDFNNGVGQASVRILSWREVK